jgi:hypothetical protein
MFTEYGLVYGIFLLLILAGGILDIVGTLRILIFRRDILREFSHTAIKWLKIFACLFFGGIMVFVLYGSALISMSQMMINIHLAAAIILLSDFILSIFLKIKFGQKPITETKSVSEPQIRISSKSDSDGN